MKLFPDLEFHRTGIGLVADPHEPDRGTPVHLSNVAGSQRPLVFCSCAAGRRATCECLEKLEAQIAEFRAVYEDSWAEALSASHWMQLAHILFQGEGQAFSTVAVLQEAREAPIRLFGEGGAADAARPENASDLSPAGVDEPDLLQYIELSPATIRFLERIGKAPKTLGFVDRAGLIERLSTFLRSPEEQHLNKAGMETNRQSFESSLWCRLAYHCFREYANEGRFELGFDERSHEVYVGFAQGEEIILRCLVPRSQIREVAQFLQSLPESTVRFSPAQLDEVLLIDPATKVEGVGEEQAFRDGLAQVIAQGREAYTTDTSTERFRFPGGGDSHLVFLEPIGLFAEYTRRAKDPDIPLRIDLSEARLPVFRSKIPDFELAGQLALGDAKADLGIITEFDSIEIVPEENKDGELGHNLDVIYNFGEEQVAIGDLLRAKKARQPYLETDSGWIDLNAPALRGLRGLLRRKDLLSSVALGRKVGSRIRLTSAELLKLQASSAKPIKIEGPAEKSEVLERILELRPSGSLVIPEGLKSDLRDYQKIGLGWLKFLYENQLAGLLCDDMGLGKTHQAMALMVLLREQQDVKEPFIVVCPRTVISHWRNKIREYAPGLVTVQHHGPHRNLEQSLKRGDVLLTSYGVLRNDVRKLRKKNWGLIVFDEIQQIKNRSTQGYQAAAAIPARMKVGLTGTPIENSLSELKALFDLILPGYLGSEDDFRDRYGPNTDAAEDSWRLSNLRRLTAPFVLRRLKTAVLDELPEKIEDIRTCTLSEEQVSLYRQAISTKGAALMEKIRSDKEPLPYIHIFALLNLLKQICDHPALALNNLENWEQHSSGKWDLFKELLAESLHSGQKVVVFTQYLGMIAIIEKHLEQLGVPSVTLTGSSRKRGAIVDRFNQDPDCRVFVGSLKAGGTGIDLVGGSVVIHYDRWWNAAREDQATDRLYRIGQKRVVHVLKLITEDTLEERIAAIIDRKRRLMASVVQADDPKLAKIFTREELIELLQRPEEGFDFGAVAAGAEAAG